jgi:hypothetical protein
MYAMTTPCPGAAAVSTSWTARSLAGAFLDLTLAWACLYVAALAAAAARLLALLGLPLPCTCARPHLPCLLSFLARYPSLAAGSLHAALRARFPFVGPTEDEDHRQEGAEEEGEEQAVDARKEERDLRHREEARTELRRELEKERSAAASATEEAMSMILRLQKEKSALEIEVRQQRRTADERRAFYEAEVDELRDIVLVRDREARVLRKEVDAYRRLLGLGAAEDDEEEDDDEQEMVTPHSFLVSEGEPSSSKSIDANRMQHFGINPGFSFNKPSPRGQSTAPPLTTAGQISVGSNDSVAVQTPAKGPAAQSRLELDNSEDEDDGAGTVEILPLSARSQDFDQGGHFHADASPGMESICTKEQTAHLFQEVKCSGIDKIVHEQIGSKNDPNVYDVHVVERKLENCHYYCWASQK